MKKSIEWSSSDWSSDVNIAMNEDSSKGEFAIKLCILKAANWETKQSVCFFFFEPIPDVNLCTLVESSSLPEYAGTSI